MKNIEHEQKKRDERIISLQTSIKNKEEALQKRVDRVKRQQDIAEAAANENRDQGEIRARENYMVQKLWCQFLKKKMEAEMKKFRQLEEAFQKIRTSTGNSDVQEMVHKFLTREQTYAQLLTAVNENEKKLDELRQENDRKEEILHTLQIDNDNENGDSKTMTAEGQEIIQLHGDIVQLKKDFDINNNRKKNIHLVCDQVMGWSTKVANKLNKQFALDKGAGAAIDLSNGGKDGGKMSMSEVFQNITDVVCNQLQEVIEQNTKRRAHDIATGIIKEDEADDVDYNDDYAKDGFADFMTDDYTNKNIRVRP